MQLILIFLLGLLIGRVKRTILMRNATQRYLIRITLFACKWFTIKIHKALVSDTGVPHDHPWNYCSLILWGGYWEETVDSDVRTNWFEKKWYGPGSLLLRKGDKLHRLVIPEGKYSISLIITTKKWRDWGFWDYYKGWVSHKEKAY